MFKSCFGRQLHAGTQVSLEKEQWLPLRFRDAGQLAVAIALLIATTFTLAFDAHGTIAQEAGQPDATIRFVHAASGSPAVDVVVDGSPVSQGIAFGAATEYAPLPAGDHQVQLLPSGQSGGTPLIDTQVTAESGTAYIVVVLGQPDELEAQVNEVNLDATTPGQARARLTNAIPDAGNINVGPAGADNWFSGVGYKETADYQDVEVGQFDFAVSIEDSEQPAVTVPGIQITEGTVYDFVALGQVGNGTITLLPVATPVSQPCSQLLGIGTAQDACVRFVHAAPGTGAVDVYVGGMRSVSGLQYNSATDFVNFPAGDQQVQIAPSSGSPDAAVIDTTQTLEAGQAYNIIATGEPDDLQALANEVNLTPLPEGQARLRFIHASPDAGEVDVSIGEGEPLFSGVGYQTATDYEVLDAGSLQFHLREGGQQTDIVQSTIDAQAGTVYDVLAVGRAGDQTLQILVLMANAVPRTGEVATPAASPMASPGASPVVGTPLPIGTPATPVAPPVGATPVAATPVPATPEASPSPGM